MNSEKNKFRKKVEPLQIWEGEKLDFDLDSSPEAWNYYQKYYINDFWKNYNISSPQFFVSVFDKNLKNIKCGCREYVNGKITWYNYVDHKKSDNNRLIAIMDKTYVVKEINGEDVKFYQSQLRLGGETDFNFNNKHTPKMKKELEEFTDSKDGLKLLNRCEEMHHTLLNFSLMQTVGNLQGFKGRCCDDRLDRFLYFLDKYYKADSIDRVNTCIAINASDDNREDLIKFLSSFSDVFDYCKKVYFIEKNIESNFVENFIKKLIVSGEKPIDSGERIIEYMNLANEFWNFKEKCFEGISE